MQMIFDNDKLRVNRASVRFILWLRYIMGIAPGKHVLFDRLARASASVALNMVEGGNRSSARDRKRFFELARGSARECVEALDALFAEGLLGQSEISEGKQILEKLFDNDQNG